MTTAASATKRLMPIRAGIFFGLICGLAIPLVLWGIMAGAMSVIGPDIGLKIRVVAESFLTMFWPTSFVLIAPGLNLLIILGLVLVNMLSWGAVGFFSEKIMSHPLPYYLFLAILIVGLFFSNGSFVWVAIESGKVAPDLIDIPSFCVAAAGICALFIWRRRRAFRQSA